MNFKFEFSVCDEAVSSVISIGNFSQLDVQY